MSVKSNGRIIGGCVTPTSSICNKSALTLSSSCDRLADRINLHPVEKKTCARASPRPDDAPVY